MKLISCENCGVAIDTDRILASSGKAFDYRTGIMQERPVFLCPVCRAYIFFDDGYSTGSFSFKMGKAKQ